MATGSETGVTITNNSSVSLNLLLYEVAGFAGVPTLDVTDGNTTASATSLSTAGTAPANAIPAFAIAGVAFNANPNFTSASNSYQVTTSTPSAVAYWSSKPLLASASQSTTFSWVTNRQASTVLVIFKDLSSSTGNFFLFF